MKKQNLAFFAIGIMVAFIFASCGGGGSKGKNNEYLGKFPSIEKQYMEKMEAKEKAIKECTDMKKSFKLHQEAELLKEEWGQKIEEYANANAFDKELPFQALEGKPYTINKILVNRVAKGTLNIKFEITINEDMKNQYGGIEKSLFVYYKAQDSQGNDIENSTTVATNFGRQDLSAGTVYEAFGTWQSKAIKNMEDFAKVVEITKEEYDRK
jgi:hypothetical protein